MSRHAARRAGAGRDIAAELGRRGVVVAARSQRTLSEEMPEAYKDAAEVVEALPLSGIAVPVSPAPARRHQGLTRRPPGASPAVEFLPRPRGTRSRTRNATKYRSGTSMGVRPIPPQPAERPDRIAPLLTSGTISAARTARTAQEKTAKMMWVSSVKSAVMSAAALAARTPTTPSVDRRNARTTRTTQ